MRYTDKSLAEQMRIHEIELSARKKLLDFTTSDVTHLKKALSLVESEIDEIVELFYLQMLAVDEIGLIIGDSDSLSRLKSYQKKYVLDLFSGKYDSEYVNSRLRIGLVHKRIGVETKHYLSAMALLRKILVEWISLGCDDKESIPHILSALDKILNFDIQLVFDTYISALVSEIEISKSKLEAYAASLEEEVKTRTRELEELSKKDPMTGLYNRRALDDFLKHDISLAKRNKHAITSMYMDMDGFKQVNDVKGHVVGDSLLILLGEVLTEIARESDIVCRMGGDEFCVILIQCNEEQAVIIAERVINMFDERNVEDCSLSIGLSEYQFDSSDSAERLIHRSDEAMYAAKKIKGFSIVRYSEMAARNNS